MDSARFHPELDLTRPSAARIYDYLLGGAHHVRADRELADQLLARWPEMAATAVVNRDFLRRAVRFLISQGIRQFLDLGSGIPTVGNVHEIAQRSAPDSRVVYVDIDPVAVAQTRNLLGDDRHATVLQADLRQPATILAHPLVRRTLDLRQPVGLLAVAVMHFVPDSDDPVAILRRHRDALVPGSYLALAQSGVPPGSARGEYEDSLGRMGLRGRVEIQALFAGFDLVSPGLVPPLDWRPDPGREPVGRVLPTWAGVAKLTD